MTNYTITTKISGNKIIRFVNFDNGTFAKVSILQSQGLNKLNFNLTSVSGDYDKNSISIGIGSLGEVTIDKISNKKMTETLNHIVFGKCELVSRNNNGSITISTKEGIKTVIEQFFMNGIIN